MNRFCSVIKPLRNIALTGIGALFLFSKANAEIELSGLFSDHAVLQRDILIPIWGWAQPNEKLKVTLCDLTRETVAKEDGSWEVTFPPQPAGGPFDLEIQGTRKKTVKNLLFGDVWICTGQSNMVRPLKDSATREERAAAKIPQIRLLKVPITGSWYPKEKVESTWEVCHPKEALTFSAVGFYFGKILHESQGIPIGLIQSAYGGTGAQFWIAREDCAVDPMLQQLLDRQMKEIVQFPNYKEEYTAYTQKWRAEYAKFKKMRKAYRQNKAENPEPIRPVHTAFSKKQPCGGYNGMIAPLTRYPIKGAIWYQGENNTHDELPYAKIMTLLINRWRQDWKNPTLPFLIVQLPNFRAATDDPNAESSWARIREAQRQVALKVPHCAMTVNIDVGDPSDIHPKNKKPVGERLAKVAQAKVYGEDIVYSGPAFREARLEADDRIRILYDHTTGGLKTSTGDSPKTFAVAGEDQVFQWAEAEINGDTIVLEVPEKMHPVYVRYGWADNPQCNLYNQADLPATPFQTKISY